MTASVPLSPDQQATLYRTFFLLLKYDLLIFNQFNTNCSACQGYVELSRTASTRRLNIPYMDFSVNFKIWFQTSLAV